MGKSAINGGFQLVNWENQLEIGGLSSQPCLMTPEVAQQQSFDMAENVGFLKKACIEMANRTCPLWVLRKLQRHAMAPKCHRCSQGILAITKAELRIAQGCVLPKFAFQLQATEKSPKITSFGENPELKQRFQWEQYLEIGTCNGKNPSHQHFICDFIPLL